MSRRFLISCALLVAACGNSGSTPTPEPIDQSGPAPTTANPNVEPPTPPAAAGPVVREASFELRGDTAGPYHAGQLGQLSINLTAREGWHVNQEYPTSVEITPPAGVTFPKTTFEKADAAQFGETSARFDVPFTPSAAGSTTVQAKVSFVVCTDENCVPDERTLAITFPVE